MVCAYAQLWKYRRDSKLRGEERADSKIHDLWKPLPTLLDRLDVLHFRRTVLIAASQTTVMTAATAAVVVVFIDLYLHVDVTTELDRSFQVLTNVGVSPRWVETIALPRRVRFVKIAGVVVAGGKKSVTFCQ